MPLALKQLSRNGGLRTGHLPLVLFGVLGVCRHLVCAHTRKQEPNVRCLSLSLCSVTLTASLTKPEDHRFTWAGWLADSQDPSLYRPVLIYRPCAVMPGFLRGASALRHQPSHGYAETSAPTRLRWDISPHTAVVCISCVKQFLMALFFKCSESYCVYIRNWRPPPRKIFGSAYVRNEGLPK